MISRKLKLILVSLSVTVILLYVATLPIITVQETKFAGEVPANLRAYAQGANNTNALDLQLNLDDANINFQDMGLNATSARISAKGTAQPDGSLRLDISLDFKNLSVKSPDAKAKIASGVMTGSLLVTKDNKLVINLQTKTSVIDVLRSLLGI